MYQFNPLSDKNVTMQVGLRPFLTCAALLCLLVYAGFDGTKEAYAGSEQQRLVVTGSSTMCPLVAEIGKRFQNLHRNITVDVQCGGSDRGLRDMRDGKADIAMLARALKDNESGLYGFPIARDGASLIVHKSNPVKSLSDAQVAAIFSGKATNWKQVGGPDARIEVILREKSKPVTELFAGYFKLGDNIRGRIVPGDNPVTFEAVSSQRYAIGYASSGEAERREKSGAPIRILPINKIMPTSRNIITGNYPITRPLTLVTRELPSGPAREFINYCLSSKVVDLIVSFDFVPYED